MIPRTAGHERVYRALLGLYPSGFRARFGDEMVQLFGDQLRDARSDGGPAGTGRTWLRTLGDLATTAASERTRRDRTVAHSLAVPPSTSSRLLGLLGIVGGALLVAAFVPFIPWTDELFQFRLVIFNVGAIAVVIAVHRRQVSRGPALAWLAAIPAVAANTWYLTMIVLSFDRPNPFAGDFGLVLFWAAVAMWVSDGWFGLLTFRLGVVSRWSGAILALGSVLALLGIDRLTLVSGPYAAIFQPLALAGIALNGIGWILLGIDVAIRRRAPTALPTEAQREG